MAANIGPRIQVDGEKDYRESMAKIIQQTKTLGAELGTLTSGFGKNNDAVKSAQEQSRVLTAQIEKQREAIGEMTSMLGKSAKAWGDSDVKTQKYQQNIYKAQTELAKMEEQLRQVGESLKLADVSKMEAGLSGISLKGQVLESELRKLSAGFDENQSAVERAESAHKLLSQQLEMQKQKVSQISAIVQKYTEIYGANDAKTLEWTKTLNDAQAELGQMRSSLSATAQEIQKLEDAQKKADTELRISQSVADATSSRWGRLKSEVANLTNAQRAHKAQVAALKSDYTESRARVAALTQEVAKSAKEHGAMADETRELSQQLEEAKQDMNALGRELSQTGSLSGKFRQGLDGISSKVQSLTAGGLPGLANGIKNGFVGAAKLGVNAAAQLTKAVAGIASAAGAGIVAMGKVAFDYNSQMENFEANFSTLLESEEEGRQKVEELKKMAASTPFEMGDLAGATEQLLAFGVQSENTGTYLQQLGDISLGNKDKLNSLVAAFGKMNSTGKVTLENINQMAEQGFNPLNGISKATGESMTDLYARVSAGKVSLDEIKMAMQDATTKGIGPFAGGMEKASQTMTGRISTLKDNARALVGEVFTPITNGIKDQILPGAISAIDTLTASFHQDGVAGMAAAAGDIIGQGLGLFTQSLPKFGETAMNIVSSLFQGIKNNQGQIAEGAVTTITTLVTGLIRTMPQLLTTGGSLLLEIAKGLAQQLPALGREAVNMVTGLVESLWANRGRIWQAGVDIVQGIIDGIASVWGTLIEWFEGLWANLFGRREVNVNVNANSNGRSIDGSHAGGLRFVPFNGYRALLHQGEMVLTRQQANQLREAGYMYLPRSGGTHGGQNPPQGNKTINMGGFTIQIYQQPGEDPDELADRVMERIQTKVEQEEAALDAG